MRDIFKKIINFAKNEKRLISAGIFLAVIFLLNQALFSSKKITAENCLAGGCASPEAEKPQLSKKVPFFYNDDILKDMPSGYYRLTFQAKTDQEERIFIKLNTYTEEDKKIGEELMIASERLQDHETFLFLPEGYDNLLFEKENSDGAGNIFVKNIGLSKLNVSNREEFDAMQKTIIGKIDTDSNIASQLGNSSDSFDLLQEPKTIFGQIFEAQGEYISGISLKMDIVKNKNFDNKDYKLYIWEVRCGTGDCQLIGDDIARISFSDKDALEKYRQADGTFLFPLYANVEKGKSYFAGIDNSDIKVSLKNYLELRGTRKNDGYAGGSAAFKKGSSAYKIEGDLFFAVRGVNFDIRDGGRLLNGAKIESLGNGQGKYTYVAKGEFLDILDLWSASPGTSFDDDRNVIVSKVKAKSVLIYRIDTFYPIQKMYFFAEQTKTSWKKMKVEYSYDQESWIEAAFQKEAESGRLVNLDDSTIDTEALADKRVESSIGNDDAIAQVFDFSLNPPSEIATVYFKITPDLNDSSKSKEFSFKNLKIMADLKMN